MAITTYAELQDAIENQSSGWMFQDALADRATDFIALCEAQMNARLAKAPVRPMQVRVESVISGEFMATPDDLVKPIAFEITDIPGENEWRIPYIDPQDMAERRWFSVAGVARMQALSLIHI